MKRVRKLGSVVFDINALFVLQDFEPNTFLASTVKSAAGTNIEYFATDNSPELTLDSNQYSLLSETDVKEITDMYNAPEGNYKIEYVDATDQDVRFRLDKPPTFTEYAVGSCLYQATIYLTKI